MAGRALGTDGKRVSSLAVPQVPWPHRLVRRVLGERSGLWSAHAERVGRNFG